MTIAHKSILEPKYLLIVFVFAGLNYDKIVFSETTQNIYIVKLINFVLDFLYLSAVSFSL